MRLTRGERHVGPVLGRGKARHLGRDRHLALLISPTSLGAISNAKSCFSIAAGICPQALTYAAIPEDHRRGNVSEGCLVSTSGVIEPSKSYRSSLIQGAKSQEV